MKIKDFSKLVKKRVKEEKSFLKKLVSVETLKAKGNLSKILLEERLKDKEREI